MESKAENGLSVVDKSNMDGHEKLKLRSRAGDMSNLHVSKLRENQDEETEDINDEDFMKEMDVVDAWEGDEERLNEDTRRGNHPRDREKRLTSR